MPFVLKQLSTNKEEYLVERTAECLGTLAEAGGKITAEAVNDALTTVIQFLDDDRDANSKNIKKYSAVLVLREFCKKLSIITFNKLFDSKKHFRLIFFTLKDKREKVRTTAADCIKECIRMINARDYQNDQKRDYLDLIYTEVQRALFVDSDVYFQQSALSILSELIQVKPGGKNGKGQDNNKIIFEILRLIENS